MDKQLDEGQRENAEVADDPVRFAEWVNRYILSATTPADDLQLCPSGEQCETLSITADERAACLREFAIMRALGACMFVARNLRPSFYKTFKASICASTARRLFAEPSPERCEQISQAISEYLEELESESPTGFSLVYLGRVYPGNPHQGGMFLAALFQIPLGRAMDCFKATREGYCSLTSGLSYETVDAIAEITDEPGGPQDDCQQPPA